MMTTKTISLRTWQIALAMICFSAWNSSVATSGIKPDVATDSVAGTTWSGPDVDGGRTAWTFEEGGTLSYKSQNGSFRNGTWTQSGNAIYYETNQRYAQWMGEISGNTMQGRAWNKNKRWTWKLTKEE